MSIAIANIRTKAQTLIPITRKKKKKYVRRLNSVFHFFCDGSQLILNLKP